MKSARVPRFRSEPDPEPRLGWRATLSTGVVLGLIFAGLWWLTGCGGIRLPPRDSPVGSSPTPTRTPRPAQATPTPTRTPRQQQATPTSGPTGPLQLESVRRWQRPAVEGQRPRLAAGPDGRLLVAWTKHLGGKSWLAVLEDASGRELERQPFQVPHTARHHPASAVGGHLLVRDGLVLRWHGEAIAEGAWETYSAVVAGERAAAIAWQPCGRPRGCTGVVLRRTATGTWSTSPLPLEVFGVALELVGDRVTVATREQPASAGWTLRQVDADQLLEHELQLQPFERWSPAPGLSLGDPVLVRGAARPTLIRIATERVEGMTWRPTGRLFLAEAGSRLREIGAVGATWGNLELGAAVWQGQLFVSAERSEEQTELWRYDGRQIERVAAVPGGAPSLAVAEGALWLSSSSGLWRAAP